MNHEKLVELKDLVGDHVLTGMYSDADVDAQIVRFTLDGIHYAAWEDPDDGYRSYLRGVEITEDPPQKDVEPVKVVARMKEGAIDDEVLLICNAVTGKPIIEIGTSDASDYYPGFVGILHPENLK